MAITVKELFAGMNCTILGNSKEHVTGIAYRSDKVTPGEAFFCIVGTNVDGHTFAQDAINRGAKVLVTQRKVYLADATDVCEVVVADTRKALAWAAANFYGAPSRTFDLVGITGTNGKTTTTYLVEHIARTAHKKTGVIGTVGVRIGDKQEKAERTTPESSDLQRTFSRMRNAGCEVVAMEVSSHALDLDRTYHTQFAVTAFSNLTQDHLDYHKTFEAYFEAKALLFSDLYPAKRVICIDDKWGEALAGRCEARHNDLLTVGFNEHADIHPESYITTALNTHVKLSVMGDIYEFEYPLVGRFNVSNMMLAFGIGLSLGIPAEVCVEAMKTAPQVPGRLQRITVEGAPDEAIFVDYAHTPDALEKAIASVKALTHGRLIVVFGCGGDRDATKRPIMGRASLKADVSVVTSDNPRSEDPNAIIDDIMAGIQDASIPVIVEPDRARAIKRAITEAGPEDAVLIAGKGHEDYQILGDKTIHFSDAEVVAEVLKELHA